MAGSPQTPRDFPLWLMTELTYKCPLQCPYCSNPVDLASHFKGELTTDEWLSVLRQTRKMGAVQLGFSGGEPLLRPDLEVLVEEGHKLGYYTNLITSSVGMDEKRLSSLKKAGLDHIQISFQASSKELNEFIAGTDAFEHKLAMAKLFKAYDFPVVFNIVIHRHNIDFMKDILDLAVSLEANQVELANTQYYGFALENRRELLPSRDQLQRAKKIAKEYQERYKGKTDIIYVIPDYYETRPKPCMNGWASTFLTINPTGYALPCHSARVIPDLEFPNIRDHSIEWIWQDSPTFNAFRGYDWMKEPCKTCPERTKDFGGCRCQAYLLTGDAYTADPVCDLSPHHHIIEEAVQEANKSDREERFLIYRNPSSSRKLMAKRKPP